MYIFGSYFTENIHVSFTKNGRLMQLKEKTAFPVEVLRTTHVYSAVKM